MAAVVIRDADLARQFVLQGLWFQRAYSPSARSVPQILTWCLAIVDAGQPLPPVGFVADVGHLALGGGREHKASKISSPDFAWPGGLGRTYEDLVLGKLFADPLFERASDALRRIDSPRQPVGLAYLIKQMRERFQFGSVEFSPGIVRNLLTSAKPEENLRRGWESLREDGPLPLIIELYQQLIAGSRRTADALALEDVFALEQKTALLSMGEYVAHRQVLQMATRLEEGLPTRPTTPAHQRREVPTRIQDEDAYPVGGFASIATRGSIESLLHSQLAFMESDPKDRPDLFDIKFLRDELYYYSRDENQFLRRRHSFVFVLHPDLELARYKDADLPCQRLILVLAFIRASTRKLMEWLSVDAIEFDILFWKDEGDARLAEEAKLLDLVFREQIDNQLVRIEMMSAAEISSRIAERSRRTHCQGLFISVQEPEIRIEASGIVEMRVNGPRPEIRLDGDVETDVDGQEPFHCWMGVLKRLLDHWVS